MDRRRFEAAHLKYAVMQLAASYPDVIPFGSLTIHCDIEDTLAFITPLLYDAFKTRYAGMYLRLVSALPECAHAYAQDIHVHSQDVAPCWFLMEI
jgi:hypothetical protein